jgi:hypothetical protein
MMYFVDLPIFQVHKHSKSLQIAISDFQHHSRQWQIALPIDKCLLAPIPAAKLPKNVIGASSH